jgi:RNA polymerase sigma-70 factor, ECF subfamily
VIFRDVEDRDLVLRARKGGVEAYNVLVSRWEKKIYNYLLRLCRNPEDAMDLSQEVFLKAYQSLSRLDDPGRFGPWLFRIAHNEAYSHFRRLKPEVDLTETSAVEGANGRRMAKVEVGLAVESALAHLTGEQREAVLLKVVEGFKFEEIAEILACPASTIKSRVYTGLELLRGILAPHGSGLVEGEV